MGLVFLRSLGQKLIIIIQQTGKHGRLAMSRLLPRLSASNGRAKKSCARIENGIWVGSGIDGGKRVQMMIN